MQITTKDGVNLSFDKKGSGTPAMIFIHGGGADKSHVTPQFDYFSKKTTAINIDLRGYGESDKLSSFGTIEQYANDIAQLCDQLNLSQVIIVGHSMGGMVAIEFAAQYPSLNFASILISSGVLFPEDALNAESSVLKGLHSQTYREEIQKLVDEICLPYDKHKNHIEKTFFAISQAQWISHFETMLAWNKKASQLIAQCKKPILYIGDDGGNYSNLTLFATLAPQLMIGKVVGSGHFPTIEVPDQVNAMIKRFLEIIL